LPKLNELPKLLYRGSIDGWKAQDFHRKCDEKGPNVVLFLTDNNRRCGAFTALSWESIDDDYDDDNDDDGSRYDIGAFLFSLDNFQVFPVKRAEYAIYCYSNHGPCFG
jgi:hypothetical protein